MMEFGYTMM